MSKLIKMMLSIALCAVLVFVLSACGRKDSKDSEYYGDYHDGYVDGYSDGVEEAQQQISGYVDECFNSIGYDNEIEEAIQILTNYAIDEPISEDELHKAIWAIEKYYYDISDIINDIEDYSVD